MENDIEQPPARRSPPVSRDVLDNAFSGPSITAVLSGDVLATIFDSVTEQRDRKNVRAVCHAFRQAEALHRRSLRVLRREPLMRLLRNYPSLDTIDLSACPSLDDSFLVTMFNSITTLPLRSVCLARACGIGWRGIEALVTACPKLEVVDLSLCTGVGDREAAAVAAASGLKELRINKCLNVTDVGLAKVAVGCPQLEHLAMKWCREISDIGIELLAKKCPELRYLDLSYLTVSNESLKSISTLEKLVDLVMVGCSFIDDEGLQFLGDGSCSLQSINFSRCNHVTSVGIASVVEGNQLLQKLNGGDCIHDPDSGFLYSLSLLKNTLKLLKLDGAELSDSILQDIGASCKNLVEIGLSKCAGVTDEGIRVLVSVCTNLSVIDLTCCRLLTDSALASIALNCKKVESLHLESCSLITEKGLGLIATGCSKLKEIDLTDCNINDTALQCLRNCSCLSVLKLGLCSKISDEGLSHISNCKELIELDLYRCTGFSDEGLAALTSGCRRLKKLNLRYCSQISDNGLNHLSGLEELSDLELRCLVRITSIGITAIATGCKSLVELDLKRCYSVDDAGIWALARYCENLRQLTISYCQVTGLGLCHLLGTLKCLQDVKMVHLSWVSIEGFEIALRVSCGKLKKLKLLTQLKGVLSPELLQKLQASGCRIRWVDKPLVFKT